MKTIVTDIEMERTNKYGTYIIYGTINGIDVICMTTDSEAFDYLNDDDYPEKQAAAQAHCEFKLISAYENI